MSCSYPKSHYFFFLNYALKVEFKKNRSNFNGSCFENGSLILSGNFLCCYKSMVRNE